MRVALNVGIEVPDDKAAAVDTKCDEIVRELRAIDGVTEVHGTISNDAGFARSAASVLDAKAQAKADKAEAKDASKH